MVGQGLHVCTLTNKAKNVQLPFKFKMMLIQLGRKQPSWTYFQQQKI